MTSITFAVLLKPLFLVLLLLLLYPVRQLTRKLPDGKLRRVLLFKPVNWRPRREIMWLIWFPIVAFMAYGLGPEIGEYIAQFVGWLR